MKTAAYVTSSTRPRRDAPLPPGHPGAEATPHRVVTVQVEILAPELSEDSLNLLEARLPFTLALAAESEAERILDEGQRLLLDQGIAVGGRPRR